MTQSLLSHPCLFPLPELRYPSFSEAFHHAAEDPTGQLISNNTLQLDFRDVERANVRERPGNQSGLVQTSLFSKSATSIPLSTSFTHFEQITSFSLKSAFPAVVDQESASELV